MTKFEEAFKRMTPEQRRKATEAISSQMGENPKKKPVKKKPVKKGK